MSKTIAAVLAAALFIGADVWVWTSAPCGLWTYTKAGETPSRCLMHR